MQYLEKEKLVLGCGNVLFGDDGFGPEVVKYLEKHYSFTEETGIYDVGTSTREILFDIILSEKRPRKIVVVDAVDFGRSPGEVFEIDVSEIPGIKIDDFSMHQLPTSNLLFELQQFCGVEISIVSVQVKNIPEEVSPGLSDVVRRSIPSACERVIEALR